MAKTPHIFTGAGNNFVVFDGREGGMEEYRQPERIQALCREYATDGLMILGDARSVSGMTKGMPLDDGAYRPLYISS